MIAQVEITGVGAYTVDEPTKKYIKKKIGSLERLAPRHARKSMHAEVKVAEVNRDKGNKYEVEVMLNVPDKTLIAKDQSSNVLVAIDIVEAKIESQIRRYKTEKNPRLGKSGIMAKFKRSFKRG